MQWHPAPAQGSCSLPPAVSSCTAATCGRLLPSRAAPASTGVQACVLQARPAGAALQPSPCKLHPPFPNSRLARAVLTCSEVLQVGLDLG